MRISKIPTFTKMAKNRFLKDSGQDWGYSDGSGGYDGGGYDYGFDTGGYDGGSVETSTGGNGEYTYNDDGTTSYSDGNGTQTWDSEGNLVGSGSSDQGTYNYMDDGTIAYTAPDGTTTIYDQSGNVVQTLASDGGNGPMGPENSWSLWDALSNMLGGSNSKNGPGGVPTGSSSGQSKPTTPTGPAAQKLTPAQLAAMQAAAAKSNTILGMDSQTVLLLGAAGAVLYFANRKRRK